MFRGGGSWEKKCHAPRIRPASFPASRVSLLGLMKDPRQSSYQMLSYITQTVGNKGSRKGQMIEWATITIILIRTLFIEYFLCAGSHTKCLPCSVLFCPHRSWGRLCYYPHFTDEESKVQIREFTCPLRDGSGMSPRADQLVHPEKVSCQG